MKKLILILCVITLSLCNCYADRIYVMNSTGYNMAEPALINAIIANGHTVTVNTTSFNSLPPGFTSTCIDSINGYDYLCFFGNNIFSPLLPQIQAFIDVGGKVFYQYEVSCCTNASSSIATILSGLTGLAITPNVNAVIGFSGMANVPGWTASNVGCCSYTFAGNAYKGLDGLPVSNQLQATATVNGGTPPVSTCPNFGFVFTTTDFVGTANQGAIVGVGDYNMWYDGGEPIVNGGTLPINLDAVNYFFPGINTTCFLLPPGCVQTFSNQAPVISLGNDTTLCQGQTLTLNATTPNATYLWQDNSTNPVFAVSQSGTYFVQVNTNCGIATDTITVAFIPAPTVNLGSDTTLCQGQSIILYSDSTASNLWSNGLTTSSITVNTSGIYWVQSGLGQCVITDSINIVVNQYPVIELGNDTTICQGQLITLNGDPFATNLWSNGQTTVNINVGSGGVYWLQSGNGQCLSSDTITVAVNPYPVINFGSDTILCQGQSISLSSDPSANNVWSDGSTGSTISVNATGIYWVLSNIGQCYSTDTISVTVNQYPVLALGNDTTICQGFSVTLNGSSSAANLWSTGSTASSITVSNAGTYWVLASNGLCNSTDSITVSVNQYPVVNLGADNSICQGQSIVLTGDNNAVNAWSTGASTTSITVFLQGTYWLLASNGPCTSADTVSITVIPYPLINLGSDTILCIGDVIILNADNSASNLWSNGSTANQITVTAGGNYWLQSSNGQCSISDSVAVTIADCESILEMPNVMTPNGDGINDNFIPIKYKGIAKATMLVFNRWGEELFSTQNVEDGWDGKSGTQYCTDGTYFWIIKYTSITNEIKELKGFLTLMK